MISLAGRDILHSWGKFVLTGIGLGLLIGATLTMAGVYRGMVDDARVLLTNSGADLWVVQKDTQGPYAEASSIRDDVYRGLRGLLPGSTLQSREANHNVPPGVHPLYPPPSQMHSWPQSLFWHR